MTVSRRTSVPMVSLFALTLLLPVSIWAKDVEGSKDHPMLSRIPGSEILQYQQEKFGQVVLPLGKATAKGKFADQVTAEGKVTRIGYKLPADRSPLEAYRQYREALTKASFDVLWSCEREAACGNWFAHSFNVTLPGEKNLFTGELIGEAEEYYLAARLRRPEGDVFAQVLTYPVGKRGAYARVRVVESRPMEEGLVKVDAEAMKTDIDRTGHVAIYGITFDTDSASIKPESKATLDEMAKLLKSDKSLSVFIVGHTDGTGSFDYNMDLSRKRAGAVVDSLVQRGIGQDRLQPHGVGPLAPVDTNETEEGRSRNRRVEIVKQSAPRR